MKMLTLAVVLSGVWLCIFGAVSAAEPPVMETVEYLIKYTADSGLTFTRNGSEHTSKEAADLMRKKLGFVKAEVKTPEDFIRLAASESHLTGKPYLVKLANGKTVPSRDWLTEALRQYCAAHPG